MTPPLPEWAWDLDTLVVILLEGNSHWRRPLGNVPCPGLHMWGCVLEAFVYTLSNDPEEGFGLGWVPGELSRAQGHAWGTPGLQATPQSPVWEHGTFRGHSASSGQSCSRGQYVRLEARARGLLRGLLTLTESELTKTESTYLAEMHRQSPKVEVLQQRAGNLNIKRLLLKKTRYPKWKSLSCVRLFATI